MIKNITTGFDSLMRKYTPDPFIYALLLTVLVFVLGLLITNTSILALATDWSLGFWSLATFTLQMVMILFLGYVVALSPLVRRLLSRLASLPKSLEQAAVCVTLVSLVGVILNWGFGLIISALYCKEVGRRFEGKKFPILVACSYSGFLIWHGGFSGSIPLVVSTPNNFTEIFIGGVIPLRDTIFAKLNLVIIAAHFIVLPILSFFLMKFSDSQEHTSLLDEPEITSKNISNSPAEILENSPVISYLVVVVALISLFAMFKGGESTFDLNRINFFLFILALLMHKTPRGFLNASAQAGSKVWPLLIQFPLYAGIMAIMQKSGLAFLISSMFVKIASAHTLPFLVYLSAGLINIFVPSGGGQWAVQGPMVIEAANELGANLNSTIMAVAWGDAWTNMIQPFWALPLLAVAGLKAKDIMGFMVIVFLVSGILTGFSFLFLN